MSTSGSRGASLIEFLVAGFLVLLPLTFAILEFAQLAAARNVLNFATFEAARAGSVTGIDAGAMRAALARGLMPFFASAAGATGAEAQAGAARAYARALLEVARPDLLRLTIENPTVDAFADFAEPLDEGGRGIPNLGLEFRNPFGWRSGQTLRDANTLALRVSWCRELVMPVVSYVLPALLQLGALDARTELCLAQRRLPIEAVAVVQMQSAVPEGRL